MGQQHDFYLVQSGNLVPRAALWRGFLACFQQPSLLRPANLDSSEQHLEEWNEQALDAVFGLLTKSSLTFVCLFVNKADLIDGNTEVLERQCIELFQPLIQRLEKRGRGRLVKIIVGSAATGQGLPLVKEHLVRESVSDTREIV